MLVHMRMYMAAQSAAVARVTTGVPVVVRSLAAWAIAVHAFRPCRCGRRLVAARAFAPRAFAPSALPQFTRTPEGTPSAERRRVCVAERWMERGSGIEFGAGDEGRSMDEKKAPGRKCRQALVSRFSTCLTWLQ